MPVYRRRPLIVQAFQLGHHEPPDWFLRRKDIVIKGSNVCIQTKLPEGWLDVGHDDWIIRNGSDTERLSVMKPGTFAESYEYVSQ